MINWKLRLQNKATLTGICSAAVIFVYSVLSALGIEPTVDQQTAASMVAAALAVLCAVGVVTDPTTDGIGDSALALSRDEPFSADEERGSEEL